MPPEIPFKVHGEIPYRGMVFDKKPNRMLVRRADTEALCICPYHWYHAPIAWWWRRQSRKKK